MITDVSKAIPPSRHRREGPAGDTEGSREFQRQYPEGARRYNWMQNQVLWPERSAAVNPNKTELGDLNQLTEHIKPMWLALRRWTPTLSLKTLTWRLTPVCSLLAWR
jgi:hypothetical protein